MPVGVPLKPGQPWFDLQVQLDGVTYTLSFRWNVRAQGWFMSVLNDQGDTVIAGGLRLVVGFPLLANTADPQPPGFFFLIDTSNQQADPTLEDLGDRVKLVYFTAADRALVGQ